MNPLRYRGYYYDNETGYYYLQSRYYDPGLGRFISADDFAYVDASGKFSINAYAYCDNNPVNFSDPSGHISITINPDEKTSSVIEAVFKGLSLAIRLDAITRAFESIIKFFNESFNFNNWYNGLNSNNKNLFDGISLNLSVLILKIDWKDIAEELGVELKDLTFDGIIDLVIEKLANVKTGSAFFDLWTTFCDAFENEQNGKLTHTQNMELFILNVAYVFAGVLFPEATVLWLIMSIISNAILDASFDYENGNYWG